MYPFYLHAIVVWRWTKTAEDFNKITAIKKKQHTQSRGITNNKENEDPQRTDETVEDNEANEKIIFQLQKQ